MQIYSFFHTFTIYFCRWSCDHEKKAYTAYLKQMTSHHDIRIEETGFTVDLDNPFFGASPDRYVRCTCCPEKRLIEVKCQYNCHNQSLEAAATSKTFCLESNNSGNLSLKRDHEYYYQVQGQLHFTKSDFYDFVVWTPGQKPHIERLWPDPEFISSTMRHVETFAIEVLLPELLSKWVSHNQNVRPSTMVATSRQQVWCYCCRPANYDMVKCCHNSCDIVLFHLQCTLLKKIPKRKSLCRNCRLSLKAKPPSQSL